MRVASNKLKDIIDFYYSELDSLFDKGEIDALLRVSIEHFLGYSKSEMVTKSGANVNQSVLIKLYDCCKELKKNIPIQYILGEAWFYGLKLKVNRNVLVPRPETEELVNLILNENKAARTFLDIGTGSGCIAIAIKRNSEASKVVACDISKAALETASENAILNKTNVLFLEADVLQTDSFLEKINTSFDVMISNPPYIKYSEKDTLEKHVVEQEPHLALFVEGNDPATFYKKIIGICKTMLNKKGRLYFELNPLTSEDVKTYALLSGIFEEVSLINDMSGNTRFLKAVKL